MMPQESTRTSTLLRKLGNAPDFHEFVEAHEDAIQEVSFSDYLGELCRQRGLIPERVIRTAQIDRTYGHQLFNGTRKPSRDKAIQLAFGFGMGVEEAQSLLRAASKSQLYPRIMRDAAVLFCLSRNINIFEAQSLLESLGLTLLGGDGQRGE